MAGVLIEMRGAILRRSVSYHGGPGSRGRLIGGLLLFLFMIPANYYYVYLALIAPLILHRHPTDWRDHALIAAFFALLVGIYIAAASSPDPLVRNYRANILVFAFFLLWIGLRLPIRGFGQWIMRGGRPEASGLETAR